jgi:hypothetical protein
MALATGKYLPHRLGLWLPELLEIRPKHLAKVCSPIGYQKNIAMEVNKGL